MRGERLQRLVPAAVLGCEQHGRPVAAEQDTLFTNSTGYLVYPFQIER